MVRSYRLTGVPHAVLQLRSDRQKFQPYGLQGGKRWRPHTKADSDREQNMIVSLCAVYPDAAVHFGLQEPRE